MRILTVYSLLFLFLFPLLQPTIQGLEPAPPPHSALDTKSSVISVPTPVGTPHLPPTFSDTSPSPSPSPSPDAPADEGYIPAPEPAEVEENPPPPEEAERESVKWCAVREEYVACQYFVGSLGQTKGSVWKCVEKESTQACLDSVQKGEADLINLDAGLAYIAFINYSMKAIANEVYQNHAKSYNSVAVVNRRVCQEKEELSFKDLSGWKSCHGSYSTAAGWNYPVTHIKEFVDSNKLSVSDFFSTVCAPSEFAGMGDCSGCGGMNGSCYLDSLYHGHLGAFRCLVEEMGDVAFMKEDTPLLFSMEGPYKKKWSTKSIREFMYLCPQGGCREINGYPGACILGTVPANVIMVHNSISSKKRSEILQTLLNASSFDKFYTGNDSDNHLLSSSAQGLAVVKQLTRSFLGKSASISQTIQDLNSNKIETNQSTVNPTGMSSDALLHAQHPWVVAMISILCGLLLLGFSPFEK